MAKAPAVLKVEVVCPEEYCDRLPESLVDTEHTGLKRDGLVFVSSVAHARGRPGGPSELSQKHDPSDRR